MSKQFRIFKRFSDAFKSGKAYFNYTPMNENNLHFLSRLSTYNLKNTGIRILLVGLTGAFFLVLATNVTAKMELNIPFKIYLQVILTFIILAEVNVLFDNLAERFFPIPEKIKARVLIHILISLTLGLLAIAYFDRISVFENLLKQRIVWLLIVLGLIFIFILIMVSISLRIVEKWIWSLKEIDRLKQAKLKSDYSSLQDQLNPHFLFNNLSVLKSMITFDPQAAVKFTQNFTDVYRYVLQSNGKTTVKLSDEIDFIKAYLDIHKERFGDTLLVNLNINPLMLHREIPPLALQLLVENAIKHNVASKKNPLQIDITADNFLLTVKNNINPKETTYSTQKGLSNLAMRYRLITPNEISVNQSTQFFTVTLPLL
ncbi:MAG: sensor histidine kinase [Salinivirgaceae bacterium]